MNLFSSNQMRQHVESTKKCSSYFGLINGEMSWSDKETPIPRSLISKPKELATF